MTHLRGGVILSGGAAGVEGPSIRVVHIMAMAPPLRFRAMTRFCRQTMRAARHGGWKRTATRVVGFTVVPAAGDWLTARPLPSICISSP